MTENTFNCFADTSEVFKYKKIYITSLHLMHGGVEMVISSLANAFVEKGFDVEVLCVYRLGEPAYFFDEKVKITYLTDVRPNRDEFKAAIRSKNPIKVLKEAFYAIKVLRLKSKSIKKAIADIKDGVIISTRNEHSVLLSKFGGANVLKIAQLHHDHKFDKNLLNDFKFKYKNIDYFTLLTPGLTDEVKEIMKKHNNTTKCITLPNFLYKTPQFCECERKNQVLSVGRFSPEKGFFRLLDVWKKFIAMHPDWQLKLIGDGNDREGLEAKAAELGVADSVIFTGMLPNEQVTFEMSTSKIYAMTSFTEGLPTVIIEAGVCSLPTIAFDVRVGPAALIEDGVSGILVSDGDIDAFANALDILANNDDLRIKMGEKSLDTSKNYSKDKIMKQWLDLFQGKI